MNNFNYVLAEDNYYLLGKNKLFICDKKNLEKSYLSQLKFPILVFDTEFINRSHNKITKSPIYIKNSSFTRDTVYLLQYAVINNYEELLNPDLYQKKIKSIGIERKLKNFNFLDSYNELKYKFIEICFLNNIHTFVCSGGESDFRIVKNWIYDVLNDEEIEEAPFINYVNSENWSLNTIDVYHVLKSCFSFENQTNGGEEFIDPKRLNKGHHNKDMIEIPSFQKLFSWADKDWGFKFKDEKNWSIYDICVNMYEFYSYNSTYRFNNENFKKFVDIYSIALDHCWNDVYKILIFLNFCYELLK